MIAKLSERIADSLIKSETITVEDKEIYTYGLQQGAYMILNLATTVLIGIVFNMIFTSIIFMIAYLPLRSYAGGYHAKTQVRCYFISTVVVMAALLAIKFLPPTGLVCSIVTGFASVIIFILAPVEDENKPLDEIEYKVYRKRALIVLTTLIVAVISFLFIGQPKISNCIAIALGTMSITLVVGKIKNSIKA